MRHVIDALTQVLHNLHTRQRVDVAMNVATRTPCLMRYSESSAIRLVSVVTSTRSPLSMEIWISCSRSST